MVRYLLSSTLAFVLLSLGACTSFSNTTPPAPAPTVAQPTVALVTPAPVASPTASPSTAVAPTATARLQTGPTASPAPSPAAGNWLRFGFDPVRSGVNPEETQITPATVPQLHRLWQTQLPGVADSSPVLLHALMFPDGTTRDVLYVTTRDGRLIALDAANGTILWMHQPRGPKITHSSPVADPSRQYVYAYGLDGGLHRYAAVSGDEVTGGGFPVLITHMTLTEKESSALNLADNHLYVTTSGYLGDAPPYQGHVVTIDLANGSAQVFNSLCANLLHLLTQGECASNRSGIWARAGAVIDPTTGNIFVATGNGPFNAQQGGNDYGDSILELSPDGARLLDSYTPATYQQLEDKDVDLGSTAPALLPDIPGSKTPLLLVQGGKDGLLRLINRQNLSGQGGPGHVGGELQTIESAGCSTFTQPVVWPDPSGMTWAIVAGTCGMGAYRVVTDGAGVTRLELAWQSDLRATTPVIAGGVLFAASSGAVQALDPHSGKTLWSSADAGTGGTIANLHWESPIVIGGRLYIADESGAISAYGR